ncbi:MAG: hypothetical protein DSZ05_00445 [Sulfurospirillum sp.]|nr:MAG: hypothetical protein DSZ05_00445 [Sulfurospirillum sp.]
MLFDRVAGKLPEVDFEKESALWQLVVEANSAGVLRSAKDISVGGIAIALAKMAATSGKGVSVSVACEDKRDIFSESFSRAIVEVSECDRFEKLAAKHGVPFTKVGSVGGEKFVCNDITRKVSDLQRIFYTTFQNVIEKDL